MVLVTSGLTLKSTLPENFVFLTDIDPTIIENSRYYTDQNFLARQVIGYNTPRIICTKEAALKLKEANEDLKKDGYKFVVYDGYRPQEAVDEFARWSVDINDQVAKEYYYPTLNKKDVFKLGYIAKRSGHSRGRTFDLTLIETSKILRPIAITKRILQNGETIPFLDDNTIDMGSSFDLFHQVSNHGSNLVNNEHNENRELLKVIMKKHGFNDYQKEWWHYTLENEPYKTTYFNFYSTDKYNN